MNKHILELAYKAGYGTRWTSTEQFDQFIEKFAQLVVLECIKEIELQYGGDSDQPMDDEWDRAIECVSSMVKYRFGV